jgi:hypothetical protein
MSYFDLKNCFAIVTMAGITKIIVAGKTIANLVGFVVCLGFIVLMYRELMDLMVLIFTKLEPEMVNLLIFEFKVQLLRKMISNLC